MDQFGDYAQVICLGSPPIEVFGPPPVSTDMARLANDGMAELVRKHPDRFPAFVASLPMNDPDGLLKEAKRAVRELGAVGVQVFTNVLGKPLTAPETLPLFELMAKLDLPIWLHPARGADFPDYQKEKQEPLRDLVDVRLAVRDERGDGAHRVRGAVRPLPGPQDHHAPHGRHDPVLRRSRRPRLGPARQAHVGRRLRASC